MTEQPDLRDPQVLRDLPDQAVQRVVMEQMVQQGQPDLLGVQDRKGQPQVSVHLP